MRLSALLFSVLICLAISLVLSAIFHTFIFLAFLPFLFGPFVFRRRRSSF